MEAIAWALFVGWIGSIVFGVIALAALKLDCWHEREQKRLKTPLPTPMIEPQNSRESGRCGAMKDSVRRGEIYGMPAAVAGKK